MSENPPTRVLTIAGSDSGGGAGIQADLKTFAALGVYGMSAVTAITAQNTLGVTAVQDISLDVIEAQIDAVVDDIGVDAVKTGMLSSPEIVRLVARKAEQHQFDRLVVDPVMVAATGARLLRENAVDAVKQELIPAGTVVTPNTFEAEVLTGRTVTTESEMKEAAKAIHSLGPRYVVVKGATCRDPRRVPICYSTAGTSLSTRHSASTPRARMAPAAPLLQPSPPDLAAVLECPMLSARQRTT